MMDKLTPWFVSEIKPVREGWYRVHHDKGTWITGDTVARWKNGKWERCFGWPAVNKGHPFCPHCAEDKGYIFVPFHNPSAYKEINVQEWRGLTRSPK